MNSRQRKARRARVHAPTGTENSISHASDSIKSTDGKTNPATSKEPNMSNRTDPQYLIGPTPPPKLRVPITVGGADRGARLGISTFAEFNEGSTALALEPIYTDPLPGRAVELKKEAALQGVTAGAIEGRVEDIILAVAGASTDPVVLNIDRASGVVGVLRQTRGINRPLLVYLLIRLPKGQLWGLRNVLEARDEGVRDAAITFYDELARASERNSSELILGDQADPAHRLAEPAIRRWFAEHTKQNLGKLVAGLEPVSNVFEVTPDGHETLPLIVSVQSDWREPVVLAEQVVASPSSPIRKGIRFVVAEVVVEKGIRFHTIRRRTDERLTVGGAEVMDRASMDTRVQALQATREAEIRRQAVQALARAERETLSRRNPVWTTD